MLWTEEAPPAPTGGARIVAACLRVDPGLSNAEFELDYEVRLANGETVYRDRGGAEALVGKAELERFDTEMEDAATPAVFREELP